MIDCALSSLENRLGPDVGANSWDEMVDNQHDSVLNVYDKCPPSLCGRSHSLQPEASMDALR